MKKAELIIDRHFVLSDIDKRLYGSFVEHLGRCVYEGIYQPGHPAADKHGFRQDVAALIRGLDVPVVRYPGGNFVSGYHWEDGVGPKEQRPARPDPAWRVIESNQFGLDEFMDWAKQTGVSPMMAVNLGSRGIEDARNLIEYTNFPGGTYYSDLRKKNGRSAPYDIKLWCLGNEMDGPWQEGHKTADEYGRLAEEAGKSMRMIDPSIETVACGSSHYHMPTFGEWEYTVLSHCYDQVDYISMHQYFDNRRNDSQTFLASSDLMDQFIEAVVSVCDAVRAKKHAAKKIHISFDEWNVWYHSGGQDKEIAPWSQHPHLLEDVYNFEDALLVASSLITLLRHADRVKIACLAQLVNVIAPIMTSDTGAWKQTIYHPFALISNNGRGHVLQTLVKSPVFESSHGRNGISAYIDAVVVENDDENALTLFAVSKNLTEDISLSCDLRQYAGWQVDQHVVLHHEDLKAVNTENAPDTVAPQAGSGCSFEGGRLSVVLGRQSFHMIRLTAEKV